MPYLNLDIHYFTHPKTRRLVGLLGKGAEALPLRLWCHCADHHADSGELAGYSPCEIESLIEWSGAPGDAVAAMTRVGFLEEIQDGYRVHGWLDHEGHISAFRRRSRAANLARWSRLEPKASPSPPSNGSTPSEAPPGLHEPVTEIPTESPAGSPPAEQAIPFHPNQPDRPQPQQQSPPSRSPEACPPRGTPAASVATGSSPPGQAMPSGSQSDCTPGTVGRDSAGLSHASHGAGERIGSDGPPGAAEDLVTFLHDRIGWKRPLSPLDMERILELRTRHGERFFEACQRLHGRVENVPAYLASIVEPRDRSEFAAEKVRELADRMGIRYRSEKPDRK